MAHYFHYWTPSRAALAFDPSSQGLSSLESGWYRTLAEGDVLWIVTRREAGLVLVLRATVAARPRQLKRHPVYAVGNSRDMRNFRVDLSEACVPHAIPMSRQVLDRLRFEGLSASIVGPMNEALSGCLASMRRMPDGAVTPLEVLWEKRRGKAWLGVSIQRGGSPVFASLQHRSRVEAAAIRCVERDFVRRGWEVVSRERDGVGYDLDCTRRGEVLHVEVKGTSGEEPLFFMTQREHSTATHDRRFRLVIVTEALRRQPSMKTYTGRELRSAFQCIPLAYSCAPKRSR